MGAKELIEKAELAASGRLYNKTSSKDDSRLFMELAAYLRLSEAREQQQERQLDQLKGRINELGLSVVPRSQFDECQEALRVAEKARDELDAQAQQLLFERDTAERKAGCATAAERAKHHHVLRRYADTVVRGVAAARMAMDLSTELAQVRAELRRLTELRPIAEAPRDGSAVLCVVPAGVPLQAGVLPPPARGEAVSAWRKFPDELPPEKRYVLVLLEGYSEAVDLGVELKRGGGLVAHTPRAVAMAYMKEGSVGPYFVTVGVGGRKRAVTHWCDCLPDAAQKPWDWLPKEEVKP